MSRLAWLAGLGCLATIPAVAWAAVPADALSGATSAYQRYVLAQVDGLVHDTRALTEAVKAGDLDAARRLYAPARVYYERIEPVAELLGELDARIDARADVYEQAEAAPEFSGFHRLEYGLFAKPNGGNLGPVADALMQDVLELERRVRSLDIPAPKMIGGAAELIEEVAATKISGEEERYSHLDLWDFDANVEGSEQIFNLIEPALRAKSPELAAKLASNFKAVRRTLEKYQMQNGGFETYDKLGEADRKSLTAAVATLAEDLARLKGELGPG